MSSIFLEVAPISNNADISSKIGVLPLHILGAYIACPRQLSQSGSEIVELLNTEELEKHFREKIKAEDDHNAMCAMIENQLGGIMLNHPNQVIMYGQGKNGLLGFFVGQVILATHGDIDPNVIARIVKPILDQAGAELNKPKELSFEQKLAINKDFANKRV